jgi:hypothetical protein
MSAGLRRFASATNASQAATVGYSRSARLSSRPSANVLIMKSVAASMAPIT